MGLEHGDPRAVGGYRLLDRLGVGGMGTVYLARGTESGRLVAVKVVHQQYADDREFRIRFRQEVAAARRVSGAFTAPVVDADPEAERPWMATLYTPGRTLGAAVRDGGPLSGAPLRQLAVGLIEALRDMHRVAVIHRDLKPDNVLLTDEGPRVIDFGISRAAGHQTLTVTGRILGTPPYMSPEQLSAPHRVKESSDVFSLGAVLVYATTGHGPFDAGSHYMTAYNVVHEPAAVAELSGTVREVVQWCLAKDPAERPTPDELLEAVKAAPEEDWGSRLLAPAPAGADEAVDPGASPVPAGRLLSRRSALASGAAVLAGAAGFGSWAAGLWDRGGGAGTGSSGSRPSGGPSAGPSAPAPVVAQEAAAGLRPTGWTLWQQELGRQDEHVRSRHASASVLMCASDPATGQIAAFDTRDGRRLWGRDFPHDAELLGLSRSGRLAYYTESGRDWGGGRGRIVAVEASNGAPVWSTPADSIQVHTDSLRTSDVVVAIGAKGTIAAWNSETGEQAWELKDEGPSSRLYTAHDRIFCLGDAPSSEQRQLRELSPRDGGQLRVQSTSSMFPLAFGADTVLLRRPDGTVVLSDWKRDPVATSLPATMGYTESDGSFFGLDPDGTLIAADSLTGKQRWASKTLPVDAMDPGWSGSLVLDGERIYVPNADGSVQCFAAGNGSLLWKSAPRPESEGTAVFRPTIAVHEGTVYLVVQGKVQALRPPESPEPGSP
ncbi:PQQ-binding-like beta-propeller repeat protein [Streptomyces sp. NPDC056773]|uniref:serine/threonine-protein kinase n=1 Tax=unclassified Streptomyces TaxID=2593676 RepID=UPI00367D38C0